MRGLQSLTGQYEEDSSKIISKIKDSLHDRLYCDLPTDELNKARVKSEIAMYINQWRRNDY